MSIITSAPQVSTAAAARAEGLSKFYGSGEAAVAALNDVTVEVGEGQFTAIMGPSGSGKSTLLHLLAGLDRPTSGEVYLGDTEITSLNDKALTLLRRDRIGFIFQSFNLLPTMTAAENIVLPMRIAGRKPDEHWVASIVETVGLTGRLRTAPRSSPAGSSSESPRPGPWRPSPRSSSRTSRPAPWTPSPVPSCSRSSATRSTNSARPSSWSPTTRPRRATPTGSSSSPTVTSSTRCTRQPPTRSSTT